MQDDAVVIGAGIMGSSIALELARTGRHVVVVDKARAVGHGSTSSSSAVMRFNFSTWSGVATAWESKFHWEHWADHLGTDTANLATYVRTGLAFLDVDIAPRSLYLPLFDSVGVPYEEWDAERLTTEIPGIDAGRYSPPKRLEDPRFWDDASRHLGAVYTPDAGYVSDPQLAAANLAEAATARGATFLLGKTVVDIVRRDGRAAGVMLDDGTRIECDTVVNAAGPWSGQLNTMAGAGTDFAVSLRPLRQEVHHLAAPAAGGPRAPQVAVADIDLGIYLRAEAGGGLLIGGTEPECDPLQWVHDPETADLHVTSDLFNAQVTRAARRFSQVSVPNRPSGVVGVYDVSEDWIPIYDKTDVPGFYVAIGTSGNQFKNAPLAGKFMAAIIDFCEAGGDHDTDPVSYTGTHSGHRIDLSAYSRLRRATQQTTGTVMG
ncbi:NAD(P)/FAD-dependent oxidoreductase [Streptomyces sp. NPDC058385]|uniref:NAD(P)/FAD-dependent oxidoreductase n=1 Tax=Streptomyces sp. NPDC058385 TaxID=3346473 RepID=UPI0036509318